MMTGVEKLEERLAQASGALSDILNLVTDSVPAVDASPELVEMCEFILGRILTSADRPRNKPGWYRHGWERKRWEKYLSGETKACAHPETACLEWAKFLTM